MDFTLYPFIALSCGLFLISYKIICPRFSSWFTPAYSSLSVAKQVEWNTRINSNIHAVLVSILSILVLTWDEIIRNDHVWGDSVFAKMNFAIVTGYLLADGFIVLWNYRLIGDLFTVFHHCLTIYAYLFAIAYGCLLWFGNFRLLAEISTPFVNQRWFFDAVEYPRSSRLFLINGIAMAIFFFLVRVLIIPPYWLSVYAVYGTEAYRKLGLLWYILISSCSLLDVINIYWFIKIVRGAVKVLRSVIKGTEMPKVE